jgi:hypothetical protein
MKTTNRVVTRHAVIRSGSFTLGSTDLSDSIFDQFKLDLPDDYEENSGARRTVITFIARPDHDKASGLFIVINRQPGHTLNVRPDHELRWNKGVGFDQALWFTVPAGKLRKGRINTIEFWGSNTIRVRDIVAYFHRMIKVPE